MAWLGILSKPNVELVPDILNVYLYGAVVAIAATKLSAKTVYYSTLLFD